MKLLHVVANLDPKMGGVSQAVRTIIKGLAELGNENEVVSLDGAEEPFLKDDSFLVHALGPGRNPWSYSKKLIPWLRSHLAFYDVVIVHGLWLYNGFAVWRVIQNVRNDRTMPNGTEAGPRLYIMPHGMLDPYFQRASGRKLKAIRNWIYWKVIENKLIHSADGLLFTCDTEYRLASVPFKPYHPRSERVVGLGVEEPPGQTGTMRLAFVERCPGVEDWPYLLFLSRIHEKKGVDLLIKAYGKLLREWDEVKKESLVENPVGEKIKGGLKKDKDFPRLVIAGPGLDTPYGQLIQELVNDNPLLSEFVFFPGMVTGEAKWGAFYGCEAFVLPSHQENFGIAVVEAMACGKPVLISNQVNINREILASGAGLVEEDSQKGTDDLLETFFKMSEREKQKAGHCARALFEQQFAVEPVARRLMHVLK